MQNMLRFLLSCFWLSSSVVAHTKNAANYQLRRREGMSQAIQEERRELQRLIPSFSADDEALVKATMPSLTLLMRGLPGEKLGDKAYDVIQTAMQDYLRKAFEDFFAPQYDFRRVAVQVNNDEPFKARGLSGGNAVTIETILTFYDQDYEPDDAFEFDLGRQRLQNQPSFRASDLVATPVPKPRMASNNASPSDLELQLAAGHVWNDLSSFKNHLLVAATIENISAFNGILEVESEETWPTNAQDVEIVVGDNKDKDKDKKDDKVPKPPKNPSKGSDLNIAAANSAVNDNGRERLNPLYPSLIVGISVFLFTIIVLGYRRHKVRQRGGDPSFFGYEKQKDNVMIHVINDTSTLQGDEEIEVEDTLYTSSPESSPNRKRDRRRKERDLDRAYATSCLKPPGFSSPPAPSTQTSSDEDDEEDEIQGTSSKTCFKRLSRRKTKQRSLGEQDSMTSYSYDSRGRPRRVDLNAEYDDAAWRNPAQLHQEGTLDNGDMTKQERKRFSKYVQSGMSIEEASAQIMTERAYQQRSQPTPSVGTGEYTASTNNEAVQSSPLDCFGADGVCGGDATSSQTQSYMSLGDSNFDPNVHLEGGARAMIITDASSYGGSYDDEDFDRALADAETDYY